MTVWIVLPLWLWPPALYLCHFLIFPLLFLFFLIISLPSSLSFIFPCLTCHCCLFISVLIVFISSFSCPFVTLFFAWPPSSINIFWYLHLSAVISLSLHRCNLSVLLISVVPSFLSLIIQPTSLVIFPKCIIIQSPQFSLSLISHNSSLLLTSLFFFAHCCSLSWFQLFYPQPVMWRTQSCSVQVSLQFFKYLMSFCPRDNLWSMNPLPSHCLPQVSPPVAPQSMRGGSLP